MPALSFSVIEILPALLNKTKVQTIRPLFLQKGEKPKRIEECDAPGLRNGITGKIDLPSIGHKKPRLKIGDHVKFYWKMRNKAKWFCKKCGNSVLSDKGNGMYRWICKDCGYLPPINNLAESQIFAKLIGE